MSAHLARSPRQVRLSVSRADVGPELGIAVGTVALTAVLHWIFLLRFGEKPPLVLFAATAAALTFWRGLGPGMLASSLGTAVGSSLFIAPFEDFAHKGSIPVETILLFAGSMFSCWLIYRLKADQEDAAGVEARRNDALAFVSHELRQPLSNIQLAAAILEREQSDETRSRATKLILRSASRLGKVIDDLADVTRLQASAIRVDSTVLRLQDTILAAVEATGPDIERRQQSLDIDVPLDPPLWVNGDAVRLQQVFGNLLSNACKYSPDGAELSISSREERGRAVIVVRDTGIGVSRDMLELIFEPFVRESRGGAEGLGIGLTLARNLVTQHGGQITAQSEGPGRGSTFVVELPLVEVQVPAPLQVRQSGQPSPGAGDPTS
jgi:signal transduction histidine kinase